MYAYGGFFFLPLLLFSRCQLLQSQQITSSARLIGTRRPFPLPHPSHADLRRRRLLLFFFWRRPNGPMAQWLVRGDAEPAARCAQLDSSEGRRDARQ
ncbi:hypothetical protein V8C37DRAFT_383541 [Trichoderma ceciliae]